MFFVRGNDSLANSSGSFFNGQSNDSSNVTSLMNSAMDGDAATTQVLINSGADVNAKNIGGATALHIAARMNNVDVIETLIKNNAKINTKDNDGWTPLMRASLAGNKEAVNVLLDNGAYIWLENRWKESALIHASISSCEECVESIIGKVDFSDVDKKKLIKINKQVDESISISKKKQNQNIEKILMSFSEKLNKKGEDGVSDDEKKKKDEDGVSDEKKKIYKLKEDEKKVKSGVVGDDSKGKEEDECDEKTGDEKKDLKTSNKVEVEKVDDTVKLDESVDEVQKTNYSFAGKKIDKTKKKRRARLEEPAEELMSGGGVSEKKEKKEEDCSSKNLEKDDSKGEVVNLNLDDWKNKAETNETKKSIKESDKVYLDNEEKEANNKEDEIEKLYIFTGDTKSLLEEPLPKKSSQAAPRYKDDSDSKEYEAEVFEKGSKEYESNDEGIINLNEVDSDKETEITESANKMEKVYIFLGDEKFSSKKKSYFQKK
jgi:hypothetical protein